jgi:hypothetical protein
MAKPTALSLPPDVFEAVVRALAEALVADYRSRGAPRQPPTRRPDSRRPAVALAHRQGGCGVGSMQRQDPLPRGQRGTPASGDRGRKGDMRFRNEWLDEWLEAGGQLS